jgi:hypothetical protein
VIEAQYTEEVIERQVAGLKRKLMRLEPFTTKKLWRLYDRGY